MGALANSGALWVLAFMALACIYLLPTLIGVIRQVDRLALVFLVNMIGGLTGDRLAGSHDPRIRATTPFRCLNGPIVARTLTIG